MAKLTAALALVDQVLAQYEPAQIMTACAHLVAACFVLADGQLSPSELAGEPLLGDEERWAVLHQHVMDIAAELRANLQTVTHH